MVCLWLVECFKVLLAGKRLASLIEDIKVTKSSFFI